MNETDPLNSPDLSLDIDAGRVAPAKGATGIDVIAAYLKHLTNSPGVYRMLDRGGDVIYVGKARSLKKRVSNYARGLGHNNRITRMISLTASMEFVTTRTESEALLLEANLIKRFRPRFNVLLRDDKSFPYILLARDHAAPVIYKHRGARRRKGDYFGPFASANAVTDAINTLQRAFLLRTCTDAMYESRTRPCLLFQIKRCSGPCTGEISLEAYTRLADQASAFLRGESQSVRNDLQTRMADAASKQEYELAADYRNRLQAISIVQQHQGINTDGIDEADIFAAHQEGGATCIQVFFFRTGQNWGNRAYFPRADKSVTVDEVLDAFIAQFYDDKPIPKLILLSHAVPELALLTEALSLKAERKVDIRVPQRGAKSDVMDHAVANAREALGRRLAESSSQRRLLDATATLFRIDRPVRRVEVYDNSHIMGTNAVGGMIVAGPQGFVKGQYRKYTMKSATLTPGDDFAMMREMLTRRFARLLKEGGDATSASEEGRMASEVLATEVASKDDTGTTDDTFDAADTEDTTDDLPDWPDLVLIDGGKGQLSAAQAVLDALGITNVTLVGVAKGPDRDAGREHFHRAGQPPMMLEPRDPVLYFIQRLRDEAHRFAISAHRQKRKKDLGTNPLDEIQGIGPARKRALLKHFGSAKAVSRAGVTDLAAVPGVNATMAQAIHDHFHEGTK
jgi:excinuclease ABC subunit C